MRVVCDHPPIFDEINAAFDLRGKKVIFAWGATIFNPNGAVVSPDLVAHEKIHCMRQGNDIEGWWRRYIDEARFRLDEEIPAHCAEYQHLYENGNRQQRRQALKIVSKKLAAPLYGRLIKPNEARKILSRSV